MERSFEQSRFASRVGRKIKRSFDPIKLWGFSKLFVYYTFKVCGLAPFEFENDRFYGCGWLGLIYPIFLNVTYTLVVLMKEQKWFSSLALTKSISRLIKFNVFANSVPTVFSILTFLILRKKFVRLGNDLYDFSQDLKIAGIVEANDKFMKKSIAVILTTIATTGMMAVANYLLYVDWELLRTIVALMEDLIILAVVLMFTLTLFLIEERFKLVNEKLFKIMESARETFSELPEDSQQPNFSRIRERNFTSCERRISYPARVRLIEGLHRQLCCLLNRVVILFSGPIFLIIIRDFHLMTYISYLLFVFVRNKKLLTKIMIEPTRLSYTVAQTGLACILQLFSIAHCAVKTSRQAGTTKTILTKMWAKFPEVPDLENEFIIFHTQLLHNWHYISVFNFFPLDYSYLYKGLCVMMAYFILMIQLEMVTLNSN